MSHRMILADTQWEGNGVAAAISAAPLSAGNKAMGENAVRAGRSGSSAQASALQVKASTAVSAGSNTAGEDRLITLLNDIWSKLLVLAQALRDSLTFNSPKKEALSWKLEVNAFEQNISAINDSCSAAKSGATGSLFSGLLSLGGAAFGEVGMTVGNAAGQVANSIGSWVSANKSRTADSEKAVADLQNKGAQSFARTLGDTLIKAREIMQQMAEMGRCLVEVLSQMLRQLLR